ncbi:pyridoxal 5'-phosphate synthase, glutaminase subunit Pdx2 [Rhinocladiella mackenziei CBS 650.93]|uniref:glutaminase n=1 Tax=Rhinocladiella mackenziei CBS 650.93 TaxID=1442369 RepID=A0A0D2J4G2_9EURO|nr:pyridoxal 5'-phosphate synthase, glutaminase subunit Pdx2 [Rhinocladiella mackenziei CBS 650.93]KIX03900.1 pyridoxal 5'-phosphate synthase, glutaminase subunit Pdx2 [Rhinocladiella mackenziei CBS 650.93]
MTITVGVLALQGAFLEHLVLLKKAANYLHSQDITTSFEFTEVRNVSQLAACDALIIPGGESTTISLVAAESGLLEPLREFVKVDRKPTWGTCAGLILLAEAANATKKGGQDLIGGLDVRVNRNHFGRQVESFQADLDLPFLKSEGSLSNHPFPGVFIRAPVVEKILPHVEGVQRGEQQIAGTVVAPSKLAKNDQVRMAMSSHVDIMGTLPGRLKKASAMGVEVPAGEEVGDIIAVQQGNVFGTSFHPELTSDIRIHVWWLRQVLDVVGNGTRAR